MLPDHNTELSQLTPSSLHHKKNKQTNEKQQQQKQQTNPPKKERKREKKREKRGKMITQKITLMKLSEAESVCSLKLMSFKNILGWERGKECVCGERVIILVLQ